MRKPKIINAIKEQESKRIEAISKESFIDMAISDYKGLEITEANKPRFLDIAGKALGYIGANEGNKEQTNNVQINLIGNESCAEMLNNIRRMLSDNA